jgi:hypothetical protein
VHQVQEGQVGPFDVCKPLDIYSPRVSIRVHVPYLYLHSAVLLQLLLLLPCLLQLMLQLRQLSELAVHGLDPLL